MSSRYRKPGWYGPGGADEYQAVLDWQNDELEHEDAMLEGRPCRHPDCNRPTRRDSPDQAKWCVPCGSTRGEGLFGICVAHEREYWAAKRIDRTLNAVTWAVGKAVS